MKQNIIVVGGGLAGISAALALARAGAQVTLLEARSRLGGRAGSFSVRGEQGLSSETVDYCQHVGMGCCANLKQLIEWLGHQGDWELHRQLHFFGPTGQYRRLSALPLLPAPLHLTGWLLTWPGLHWRDRLSVARGMLAIRRLRLDGQAERQSAMKWLVAQGQTAKAIEHFWRTIVVSALGEELERVHLAAVGKVLQDGFLNDREAFHLLVPTRPLGELFGRLAVEQLEKAGVDVRREQVVQRIDASETPRVSVQTAGGTYRAAGVVLAIPWHQLDKLHVLGHARLQQVATEVRQLESSSITGVHTWWDRAWMELPHAAIVGRLCQWVFPKAGSSGTNKVSPPLGDQGVYYQVVVSASRNLRQTPPEALAKLIHRDLAAVFPAVRNAKLLRCKAVTDPKAVFSIAPNTTHLRPPHDLGKGVALAGDWTDTGWPATMEGAILSGFRAAQYLLASPQKQL